MSKSILAQVAAFGLVLAGLSFGAGLYVGEGNVPAVARVEGVFNKEGDAYSEQVGQDAIDFMPYWRVWNTLENKFIPFSTTTPEAVEAEDRMFSSIEGLVGSYDDPYTVFMRPQQAEDFKIAAKGSLEGIGALIGEREGGIIVVQPLPHSPAEKAGLVPGDKIVGIDGTDTTGMQVNDAVNLIRGEGGTDVVLRTLRVSGEEEDVTITRGKIEIPSTARAVVKREVPVLAVADKDDKSARDTEPGTPYEPDRPASPDAPTDPEEPVETEEKDFYVLRLFNFSESSVSQFERELKEYVKNGTDSLIIDLRGNPGGYMDAAVDMASWFLPAGTPVVRERSGPNSTERTLVTRNRTLFTDPPKLAVLVDKSSASASEILAGALQEQGRAVLIGQNTFGKGSVQELVNITSDLALKVTVARWYTPNGISISEGGLTPDVVVSDEMIAAATSSDPWVDAAIEHLTQI
jgi:carboxyl-terminal processing protease